MPPLVPSASVTEARVPSIVSSATVAMEPSATPSASAEPTATVGVKALEITSVVNFRDVAGGGLEVAGGGRMSLGVVYRSAKLTALSASDSRKLAKAGLSAIIDLRTDSVAARRPDPAIKGVKHYVVNVLAVPRFPAVRASTVTTARAYMRKLNADFVDLAGRRKQIARVLSLIATGDGPVLIHCTEGKDRTGWLSAVLQLAAGASRPQVLAEYVKSNQYRAALIDAAYRSKLKSSGRTAGQVQLALSRLRPEYLDAGLDRLEAQYGDISGYLTRGLGLSAATVERLRERLTT